MSSICSNMTLDLLFYPGKKTPQMSCNKIHYFSLSSLSRRLCVLIPPGVHPSSLHCGARGPRLSSRESNPHGPLHSSFYYQKPNPLTGPHKREIQSVYPPAQWEIWTRPFTKRYTDAERTTDKRSWSIFSYFNSYTKKKKMVARD